MAAKKGIITHNLSTFLIIFVAIFITRKMEKNCVIRSSVTCTFPGHYNGGQIHEDRLAPYMLLMGEKRKAQRILAGKTEERRPFGRAWRK
jgi:hypothetical protein